MRKAQKTVRFCRCFAIIVLAALTSVGPERVDVVAFSSPNPARIIVTITPPKATLYSGETQFFLAKVVGCDPLVTWSVKEEDGGTITDEGLYTAPKLHGVYHVTAATTSDPRTKAVAEVTVLAYCDPPSVFTRR